MLHPGGSSSRVWFLFDLREASAAPQLNEFANRRRAVTLIVIVRIRVDGYAAFLDLVAEIDPTTQLLCAIYNNLVPSLRHRFDGLAVAKPANVRPVCSNRIEFQF